MRRRRRCSSAHALGGAIAARFAARHRDRIDRLVLVDSLGLRPFEPAPDSAPRCSVHGRARTSARTTTSGSYCALDLDAPARRAWASAGSRSRAYNLDRARDAERDGRGRRQLMERFGLPGDPAGRAGAHRACRPRSIWGRARPGDAARGGAGGERPPRLAAARDRGLRRRPAGRAARGVRRRAAPCVHPGARARGPAPAPRRRRLRRGDAALERDDRQDAGARRAAGRHRRRRPRRQPTPASAGLPRRRARRRPQHRRPRARRRRHDDRHGGACARCSSTRRLAP